MSQSLPCVDDAVRQIRQSVGRRAVSITTFSTFASMWLIPRLEGFQEENADIDIRIDTSHFTLDLENAGVDVAFGYGQPHRMPPYAVRLFGEQLTPVMSPKLRRRGPPLKRPSDFSQFTLVDAGDLQPASAEWLTWQRWFNEHGLHTLQPKRWLYLDTGDQIIEAALAGQGVALARAIGHETNGERRLGRAVAEAPHGFTARVLAGHEATQHGPPAGQVVLRLAAGPEQPHALRDETPKSDDATQRD
ncbi:MULTISPECIES: LysR substrate-binding domain-containing protein [unclassified Bradyrhizobium]|uniref:LysR substrate-binding domain-containing protein n=1 Tax=unclassified Bradyrhizobium TaxID=2631580 RepID=UPI001FFEC107|nr:MULTISPECIES: LysR substrate-binding domain-containing protein [unclassified Bradyrhizobium]